MRTRCNPEAGGCVITTDGVCPGCHEKWPDRRIEVVQRGPNAGSTAQFAIACREPAVLGTVTPIPGFIRLTPVQIFPLVTGKMNKVRIP